MTFTKLVPSVFYADIDKALRLFVDCLDFTVGHSERDIANPYAVVNKDQLSIMIFEDEAYAKHDHPELRLVTSDIEDVYAKVSSGFPDLLHPNLNEISLRPWGAREFGIMDGQIGIRVQQW